VPEDGTGMNRGKYIVLGAGGVGKNHPVREVYERLEAANCTSTQKLNSQVNQLLGLYTSSYAKSSLPYRPLVLKCCFITLLGLKLKTIKTA